MSDIIFRGENATPIVIAHRTVKEPPEIIRKKKFLGFKEGLKTLLIKGIEFIESSFWVEERSLKNAEQSQVTYYSVDIDTDGYQDTAQLVATKLDGTTRPACGHYYEVIKMEKASEDKDPDIIGSDEPIDRSGLSKAKRVSPKYNRGDFSISKFIEELKAGESTEDNETA